MELPFLRPSISGSLHNTKISKYYSRWLIWVTCLEKTYIVPAFLPALCLFSPWAIQGGSTNCQLPREKHTLPLLHMHGTIWWDDSSLRIMVSNRYFAEETALELSNLIFNFVFFSSSCDFLNLPLILGE